MQKKKPSMGGVWIIYFLELHNDHKWQHYYIICVSIILSDVYSYTCTCYKNVFLDVGVTL